MILAGNRFGKTHGGARESIAHSLGYDFWRVPDIRLTDEGDFPDRSEVPAEYWVRNSQGLPIQVPNEGMCITGLSTQRGIGQVIWPELRSALPPKLFRNKRLQITMGPNSCPYRLTYPNGSVVWFGSKEQSRDQWEGFRLHWAWVDEPVPHVVYNGLWRSLSDYRGSIWFTLTPLGPDAIWLMEWVENDRVWKITGPQRDNTYLPKEVFDEFEQDGRFTKREKQARLYGEFEFLGSRVFENLEPEVHFIKAFQIPEHWIVGQTVDPHHKKAAAVVWWAVNPETEPRFVYHFFREWPQVEYFSLEGGGMSPTEYATMFRDIENRRPAQVRICDPRFGKAEWIRIGKDAESTVWVTEMADAGLIYDANVKGIGRLEIGHTRITEMLRWDRNYPISPTNSPRIFVHDTCPNLMKAMTNYAYEEVRDLDKGVIEKVAEKYKDFIDCVRYTVLYEMPNIAGGDSNQFSDADFAEENQGGWI